MGRPSVSIRQANELFDCEPESDFAGDPIAAMPGFKDLGLRIAVLDDDLVFLQVVERYARQLGVRVYTVATASELGEAVSTTQFDAVVVDYYLDNYLGSEVADALPGVPVILTSRKSDWARSNPVMPPPIQAFVHKKYGAKVLLQKAIAYAIKSRFHRL